MVVYWAILPKAMNKPSNISRNPLCKGFLSASVKRFKVEKVAFIISYISGTVMPVWVVSCIKRIFAYNIVGIILLIKPVILVVIIFIVIPLLTATKVLYPNARYNCLNKGCNFLINLYVLW